MFNEKINEAPTMKAIGFLTPSPTLSPTSFEEFSLPDPVPLGNDLLIHVRAASVNPVDYKERRKRLSDKGVPVILGWDGAGDVVGVGSHVTGFKQGDKVFWSGDFRRPGSNASLQCVDYRLVSHMPKLLDYPAAAAMPLTAITAYEALFERLRVPRRDAGQILVIGGAGGVGSVAIQLLRALSDAEVYATAGRQESKSWTISMGAHHVVERVDLLDERARQKLPQFDYVFSTTHTDTYHDIFPELISVGGRLGFIDDPLAFDVMPFKSKSIGVHPELIFSKGLYGSNIESQGQMLAEIAKLIDSKALRSTVNTVLDGLTPAAIYEAHKLQESGTTIGKTVIRYL
jgi:NADPH2:quinone reductase